MSYRSNWGRTHHPNHDSDPGDCTDAQLALDVIHPCPTCSGTGRLYSHASLEAGEHVPCRVCDGTGQVLYDPDDTNIPY